ncbi:MAG: prephenate dehydrogenase/arogenate dehydrogenase family protein [Rhodothermia bacterium]
MKHDERPPRKEPDELDALRSELAGLDREVLLLAARRRDLVVRVGALKEEAGSPTRDFSQERIVLERARAVADELGLTPRLSDALMRLLIAHALATQEQQRIQHSATGSGRSVLVIGGAGRMGRWFVDFLSTQGFRVEVADPAGQVEGFEWHEDWEAVDLKYDFVLIAAPLRPSAAILERLARLNPAGIVFDIGSLKSPLANPLRELSRAGVRVTSIHPMFGPDTEMLSGKHVVLVNIGDDEATRAVGNLFSSTMANVVEMSLEDHDRLIALVLGLSHALNIAFFSTLARSGESTDRLARLSSTTFDEQLRVASKVAAENPHLYFEIQHLNEFGPETLALLKKVVVELEQVVISGDEATFTEIMEAGRQYLDLASS